MDLKKKVKRNKEKEREKKVGEKGKRKRETSYRACYRDPEFQLTPSQSQLKT